MVWFSGICVFCLAVVFAYDWYLTKQEAKKPVVEETAPAPEPVRPDGSPKPQYGFPDLGE